MNNGEHDLYELRLREEAHVFHPQLREPADLGL